MIARKTSAISVDSAHSTRSPCSSVGDCDADDEGAMSMDESKNRPLSVSIPKPPLPEHSRSHPRPNLRDILANNAPPPWTLTAFMAYLSNNHCLETLEFTMDAGRYKKHYQRMMSKAPTPGEPSTQDAQYVKELWNRLIDAYIRPNGSREVNLPSEVRDPIIRLPPSEQPPVPELLDHAVEKTYELMEESVLVPFLNSAYLQSVAMSHDTYNNSSEHLPASTHPHDENCKQARRTHHHFSRSSPPPQGPPDQSALSPQSGPNRKSAPSALTTALTKNRFSTKLSPTSSVPANSLSTAVSATSSTSETAVSGSALTDDSVSSGSPTNDSPMTPPVTPPMGDLGGSPRASRDSGTWKKFGRLSGWKPGRKRSQGFKDQDSQ